MKKRICLILLTVLCLSGCKENKANEDKVDAILQSNKPGENIMDEWDGVNYYNDHYSSFAESKNGFYYVIDMKMMYASKNTEKTMIMCTRPECDHVVQGETDTIYGCEALYALNTYRQVYNGMLYADAEPEDDDVQSLICAELDGTGKKEVIHNIEERLVNEREKLYDEGVTRLSSSITWRIYDDVVYVFTTICAENSKETSFFVDMYNVDTGKYIGELINRKLDGNRGNIGHISKTGNKLMVSVDIRVASESEMTDYSEDIMYMEIDVDEGKTVDIEVEDNETSTHFGGAIVYQPDNKDVYVTGAESEPSVCIELNEFERKYGVIVASVGDYLFVTPFFMAVEDNEEYSYYTKVYDKDFKLLDTIELPADLLPMAGHDQIILKERSSGKFFYIDASQIGTGNVEVGEYTAE